MKNRFFFQEKVVLAYILQHFEFWLVLISLQNSLQIRSCYIGKLCSSITKAWLLVAYNDSMTFSDVSII